MPGPIAPYTVTLTSCGRYDLLKRTLASLLPRLEGPCEGIVIGEDGGNRRILDVVDRFRTDSPPIEVILLPRRIGICGNIDRIYQEVRTDWIFHCEDDWEFFRSGFIRESFEILAEYERVSAVGLRATDEFRPGFWCPGVPGGFRAEVAVAGRYAGLHFNPGLRRMGDYRAIGPYAGLAQEADEGDVGRAYLEAGLCMACLSRPAVRHIGWGRSVGDAAHPRSALYWKIRALRKKIRTWSRY